MLGRLLPARNEVIEERAGTTLPMSWDTWQSLFSFNGNQYQSSQFRPWNGQYLIAECGPVYTVIDRRASIMGEARPVFQRLDDGKPTDSFSPRRLEIMKKPWRGGSFRQLVAICETDVAACGNSYWIRLGDELVRLEADWVTIVTSEVVVNGNRVGYRLEGYAVARPGEAPELLEPDQVAHYRPGISNHAPFRGESWLASVSSDASSDVEMTRYKGNYLKNGAMPSLAVLYEPDLDMAQLEAFVPLFNEKFVGPMNAGKVMHLLGGRDAKTVGATLDDLSFKAVQGAGETRIASAAGVPAVVAGFSEGMQGSSLNAGNYVATRRLFADAKIRPLLGSLFEAFANIVPAPAGSRLWYDDSQVSFFQEDVADEANIRSTLMSLIRQGIEAGFDPDAVVEAASTGNFTALLGQHSGLTSVQLQPPTDSTAPALTDDNEPDEPDAGRAHGSTSTVVRSETVEDLMRLAPVENHLHLPSSFTFDLSPLAESMEDSRRATEALTDVVGRMAHAEQPAPVVHINVPEQPAPVVNVNVPEQPAPVVNVNVPEQQPADVHVMVESPRTKHRVRRDDKGNISEIIEEPV
jgi:hypothetical protein